MARSRFIPMKRKCPRGGHCKIVGRGKRKRKLFVPKKR